MSASIYKTNKNECRFYPVQCTQEIFDGLKAQEGHVYFITDKKKLYLGKNGEKIPMCASSGIFYGMKPIEYDNSGNKPDPKVTFIFDEIEGEDMPELDDLILNVGTAEHEDGCFYRVVNIIDDTIETTRLTLQGTGGGGGGPSGPSAGGSFSLSIIGTTAKVYSSTATSLPITFKGYYNGTEENRIAQVKFTKRGETEPFYVYTDGVDFNVEKTLDLFPYMNMFGTTRTTVTIAIQDLYGNERSTNFTVQIVELALKATKEELLYSNTSSYMYSCNLAGATSGVSNKKITYTFYREGNLNTPVDIQYRELSISDEGDIQKDLDLSKLSHGVYVLEVVATAMIGASNTTLYSNKLTHKIGRFNIVDNTPLLMIKTPEVTEQYTNIPVHYLLVTQEANNDYTLNLKLDGTTKINLSIKSNTIGKYELYFEEKGTYTLSATIQELAISYSTYLVIAEYTGNLPVIDPNRDDLMLYLNPRGKSNDATDRDQWQDYKGVHTGVLSDLHYGKINGWMTDDDGTSYLKLSSGASLYLPTFTPFRYDPTRSEGADPSMGYGMTIELDFEISGVLNFNTDIIKCYSTNQAQTEIPVGFRITGDRVRFYNSRLSGGVKDEALSSLNLVEGKRTRVTFVLEPNTGTIEFPMCYIYLDGKLSGATIYATGDAFKDGENPAKLEINSENAQVKIYGIRYYSSALADKVILNNYTASLPTLAERQERFDSNNVFNAKGEIDYVLVAAEDYDLQIPYMKITGGWATESDSKWQLKNQTNANVGLPTGKKDYRLIDVEVKYPDNEYFAEYKDYKFVNKFASGKSMAQAYGEKPSNGGAIMYAQGTSSMEYPVKNLRLRFNKVKGDEKPKKNFYTVRPDIAPVEIICMKADYMESSGSHNTGAANLVDAAYVSVGIQSPGQEHFGGDGKDTIVTCIKGHPCLIFYSETGEAGSYKYIGKYNLNLDKATSEPFGFDHDDDSNFGYLDAGETYYKIQYKDDDGVFIGQADVTRGGDYVEGQEEVAAQVQEGEKINSIHCFEFLDNAVQVCNFKAQPGYDYQTTWYGEFTSDNKKVPGWTLGFESRYPEDRVGYHDADSLYPLALWLHNLYNDYEAEKAAGLKPTDIEETHTHTLANAYADFTAYFIKTESGTYEPAYPTATTFVPNTYYTRTTEKRFKMNSLELFKRSYQCYLDKDFLLSYYLITEALLMADSRVKNMMIATWHKEKKSYVNLDGNTVHTNNYIFYPIFYDMDTMLGLDNTGVYRFKYYDEDTDADIYNGDEVLWNFVRDALGDELKIWFSEMERAILTSSKILPYFNKNQANMANEAFYNGDAMYKYIRPAREGYIDHLHENKVIKPGEAPFLYAAQGDRSLMREWFLTNRMKFLRGKYNSEGYQGGDRIEFRWYYPTNVTNDPELSASIAQGVVPPGNSFSFTSLKTGYAGVKLGANGAVYNERFDGVQNKTIVLPEASSANGTEAYLLGLSNLTDLGDLSNKYMQKFIIASDDCRLTSLTLGNPHKDYHNPYWKPGDAQSQQIGVSGCTYLESFNLQHCKSYNNIMDFEKCPAIKQILLTGSGTTGLVLPVNGVLEELRLPTSVKQIKIVSHGNLNENGFSIGTYNYGSSNKIEPNTPERYINDYTNVSEVYVVDTPIHNHTYRMVTESKNLTGYYIQGFNWTIDNTKSLYCKILSADEFIPGYYYKFDTNINDYVSTYYSTYPPDVIYKKSEMLDAENNIVEIPVLEFLRTKTHLDGTSQATALKGTITISTTVACQADELALYEKYHAIYPNVKIQYGSNVTVKGAIKINFYRVDVDTLTQSGSSLVGVEPYFSTLTTPNRSNLADLIGENSGFTDPQKTATNTEKYSFSGTWYDWNDPNKTIYYQDVYWDGTEYKYWTKDTPGVVASRLFSEFSPSEEKDMMLVPKFTTLTRKYTVKFYDWDYKLGDDPIFSLEGEFENVVESLNTGTQRNPRAYYMYRPATDLPDDERYGFKGWQNESDFNNKVSDPQLVDLTKVIIRSDLNYFAHYTIEKVNETPSNDVLFNIVKDSSTILGKLVPQKYVVRLNPEYQNIAGGKITIPSTDKSGNSVEVIAGFNHMPLLDSIHFTNTANYTAIADNAFEESSLVSIKLPSTITTIGNNSFRLCRKFEYLDYNDAPITAIGEQAFYDNAKLVLDELPPTLTQIGDRGFYSCDLVSFSILPEGLTTLSTQCFMSCPLVTINHFPAKDSGIWTIGKQCLFGCGKGVETFTIEWPWQLVDKRGSEESLKILTAPQNTGYPNLKTISVHTNLLPTDDDKLEFELLGELTNVTIARIT